MQEDDIVNSLWVHKYRPKVLEDVKLEDNQKLFFSRCLKKNEIPHLLFVGPPGSGKCHSGDELIDIYVED